MYVRISLDLCQYILKDFIVVLYAIIQVDLFHLVGMVMDFFFVDLNLLGLRLQRGQLLLRENLPVTRHQAR